jgi:hypothetical protein
MTMVNQEEGILRSQKLHTKIHQTVSMLPLQLSILVRAEAYLRLKELVKMENHQWMKFKCTSPLLVVPKFKQKPIWLTESSSLHSLELRRALRMRFLAIDMKK